MLSNHNGKIYSFQYLFAICKYSYNLRIYKARKPREARKTYVKDYLKTPNTKQKNKNVVIGTQSDHNIV